MSDETRIVRQPALFRRFRQVAGQFVRLVVLAIAAGISLQTAAIIVSRVHPVIELANHFAAHGLAVASVTLLVMLLQARTSRFAFGILLAATVYLLFLVQPWGLYLSRSPSVPTELKDSIRVLSWNVLAVNRDYADIDEVIRSADADVVVLIETQPNLLEQLPYLMANYPYSHKILHWGGNGICVFSKIAGTEFVTEPFHCVRQPAIVATIPGHSVATTNSGAASVKLVGMHTLSPMPIRRTAMRDEQLAAFVQWSNEQSLPVCVCGDLNTTPWTRSFGRLERTGFVDSRRGVGNLPSWPSALGVFGIPIDHALTRGKCSISDRKVLAAMPGSDHHPIAFTLHF